MSAESLLLDPSAVLGDGGFGWLEEIPHLDRGQFVVSRTFFEQVAGREEWTAADSQLWGPLPAGSVRAQLEELLAGVSMLSEEDAAADLSPEVLDVAARLGDMGSRVAVEQWLSLQSHSWLAARTRRVLEHFKQAGARSLEIAIDALDGLTWLALGRKGTAPTC